MGRASADAPGEQGVFLMLYFYNCLFILLLFSFLSSIKNKTAQAIGRFFGLDRQEALIHFIATRTDGWTIAQNLVQLGWRRFRCL